MIYFEFLPSFILFFDNTLLLKYLSIRISPHATAVDSDGKWAARKQSEPFGRGVQAMQEEIRALFREYGWTEEVHFDSYVEEYAW